MVDDASLLKKCGGGPRDGHLLEGTMVSGLGG